MDLQKLLKQMRIKPSHTVSLFSIVTLLISGCQTGKQSQGQPSQSARSNQMYDPITKLVTPQLVNKHLMSGMEPVTQPAITNEDKNMLIEFQGCLVTIGRGSSFFTDADYKALRKGLFGQLFGNLLVPKIGRRAYIAGIEQD